jgi:hypothetical protein
MSAIALCLGDLAKWRDLLTRAYLTAGLGSVTTLAVHTRIALLRIFVRSEGLDRMNRKPPTESFANVLGTLTLGLGPEAKLMTEIFLASQFCDQRVAPFTRPFEQDYDDLRRDIVALAGAMVPEEEAPRSMDMVRRLAETHDYPGICLYLYDEFNGGNREPLAKELVEMACDGVIKTAYHDQSRRHLCGCFLRLDRFENALAVADNLAFSNPDSVDFQILRAQVMTSIPERYPEARSLACEIERRYKLNDDQLRLIEGVRGDSSNATESDA